MVTSATINRRQLKTSSSATALLAAGGVLIVSLLLAVAVQRIQSAVAQPERAVLATGLLFGALLAGAMGLYLLRSKRDFQPETAGLTFLTGCAVLLLATYFFQVAWYVFFPADILIWAESDFVNDILKFSIGYPLYTAPANNDSFHYVPGAQLLTYFLSKIAGTGMSIPAWRIIQLVYTALAAFFATLCCRRILHLALPGLQRRNEWLWTAFWFASFFLMATNSITNTFSHNLHGDALAQLATLVSFWLLLVYIENRSYRVLAGMAAMVSAGFFVKQSLLVWAGLYFVFIALWDRSRKRLAVFTILTAGMLGVLLAVCYVIWGRPFFFWIFYEQSKHTVSPLRAFQHILDAWAYFAAALLGGAIVLRGRRFDGLTGAWLISVGLLSLEAYTSGIEWMLNHMGPGCLLAGIWFCAALGSLWNGESRERVSLERFLQTAAVAGGVALFFSGMGLVRIPLRPLSSDAYRYVSDIEKEFQGQPASSVLLDTGSWLYLKDRVVMGDRANPAGSQGSANFDPDYSGFFRRIAAHRYSKILVRDLHEKDCWYENALWPKVRGLRQALLDNYRETGQIPAATGPAELKNWAEDTHLFGVISILEPKTDSR